MSAVWVLGALLYGLGSYRLVFGRWPLGLLNRIEYYASGRDLDDAGVIPSDAVWFGKSRSVIVDARPFSPPNPDAGKDAPVGSVARAEYNLNQVRRVMPHSSLARAAADYHKEIYAVEVGIDEHGIPLPPAVVFSDTPEPPVPNLRPAVPEDYAEWLAGYLSRGGRVSHQYSYPMCRGSGTHVEFWVTTGDVTLPPLYGSNSVQVIVRPGHRVRVDEGLGHSSVFWLDGFTSRGLDGWVPGYSDVSDYR